MKRHRIILSIATFIGLLNSTFLFSSNKPLKHRALAMVDGLPYPLGVDCKSVDEMVHGIKEIFKRQFGVKQGKSNKRVGVYTFKTSHHSIQSLADLEQNALVCENSELLSELAEHLIVFRNEFVDVMRPLLHRLQGLPQRTAHELMKEWADLHDRHDSIIFEWCKHKVGNEEEIFNTQVDSFVRFNQFCSDVVSFLDDLIKSCPIGYQQYLDAIHQKK